MTEPPLIPLDDNASDIISIVKPLPRQRCEAGLMMLVISDTLLEAELSDWLMPYGLSSTPT